MELGVDVVICSNVYRWDFTHLLRLGCTSINMIPIMFGFITVWVVEYTAYYPAPQSGSLEMIRKCICQKSKGQYIGTRPLQVGVSCFSKVFCACVRIV